MTKEMKFEEQLKSLETIVNNLEKGEVDLDEALKQYELAMKMAKACSEKLKTAETQVNKILTEAGTLEEHQINESSS